MLTGKKGKRSILTVIYIISYSCLKPENKQLKSSDLIISNHDINHAMKGYKKLDYESVFYVFLSDFYVP